MDDDPKDQKTDAPLQPDQSEDKSEEKPEEPKPEPSDQLTPEHPRFKQVLAENKTLKEKIEAIEERISKRQEETGDEELNDEERLALEKIDRQLKVRGYMTRQEFLEEQRVQKMASQFERLSEKYDGSTGYPKFVADDVAAFAKARGIDDMEDAYFIMHRPAITQLEAKKGTTAPQAPPSEKPTGGEREQPQKEFTPEQIATMSDDEWEKNRQAILGGIKASVTPR